MLNKTKIALSTLLIAGFASAALAEGAPVNTFGNYPLLQQTYQQSAGEQAFASAAVRHPVKPFTAAERALFEHNSAVDR
jgi:hypothetical protein